MNSGGEFVPINRPKLLEFPLDGRIEGAIENMLHVFIDDTLGARWSEFVFPVLEGMESFLWDDLQQ